MEREPENGWNKHERGNKNELCALENNKLFISHNSITDSKKMLSLNSWKKPNNSSHEQIKMNSTNGELAEKGRDDVEGNCCVQQKESK